MSTNVLSTDDTADGGDTGSSIGGTCAETTKVCTSDMHNYQGKPVFQCQAATHGTKVAIKKEQNSDGAVICGTGTFYFSPLCGDDDAEYKQTSQVIKRSGDEAPA